MSRPGLPGAARCPASSRFAARPRGRRAAPGRLGWAAPCLLGLALALGPGPEDVHAIGGNAAGAASAASGASGGAGTGAAGNAASGPLAPAAAETRPVMPPGAISSIPLPPVSACRAVAPSVCTDLTPLSLERQPETLPRAREQIPYLRLIQAEGGQAPYSYALADGGLPAGLSLSPQGLLSGTPTQVQQGRFRIRVRDAQGRQAQQAYVLQVLPAASRPATRPTPPAAAAGLKQVDLQHIAEAGLRQPDLLVYQLKPAQLDALKTLLAPAEPPTPASSAASVEATATAASAADLPTPEAPKIAWSEAQQTQLQHWLAPIMGIEYPSRALFLAAVDALACAQADELLDLEAQRTGQARQAAAPGPGCEQQFKQPAPPAPAASKPGAPAEKARGNAHLLQASELPRWLLPRDLRPWLADAAAQPRSLDPLPQAASAAWPAAEGCGCVNARASQTLYAIAPTWQGALGAEPLDFSLIHRLTAFAFSLPQLQQRKATPPGEDPDLVQRLAFIETARRHDSRVDLGIYHRDWRFLAGNASPERDRDIQRLLDDVPRQARLWLDAPLPGTAARWKARLPGFGEVQRLGDGLTLFFDDTPTSEQNKEALAAFTDFYPQFVKRLAAAMAENPERKYALNLMLSVDQIQAGGPMAVARLFELLKAVEKPEVVNGRIVETPEIVNGRLVKTLEGYRRHSNVVLRFLVLLPEPSVASKKLLHHLIENSPALKGGDRRIFMRSVVPVLVLPQRNAQQFEDDLVYVQDNFDGIGFWPAPLIDSQISAEQRHTLRRIFVPDAPTGLGKMVCSFVCPNRWLLRLVFDLLVLLGLLTWAALQWNCEWRAKYGRPALLAGIPPLILGAGLLQCDPALAGIRNSNAQLLVLIAIPVIAALLALLKRKVEKP